MEDKIGKLEAENRDLLENIKRSHKDSRNTKSKTDELEAENQDLHDKCLSLEVRVETLENKNKE